MAETILNIYLVIEKGIVTSFKVKGYEREGSDEDKIEYLKFRAEDDFKNSYHFDAPRDKRGNFMKYRNFAKLESQGMHFQLFETIFSKFSIPEKPLICVTPVVDGEIWAGNQN